MNKVKIKKFEDLIAWQKARELAKHIYHLSGKNSFSRDFRFREQIRKASVSIMSNLVGGFGRGSKPDFHKFIVIAKGSCAEVRSPLYIALDVGYISKEEFEITHSLVTEVSLIIGGLRSSIKKNINN